MRYRHPLVVFHAFHKVFHVLKIRSRAVLLACALSVVAPPSATQASQPYYPEDIANWHVISGWVKELPAEEQTIVLVLLALGLDQHVNQKVIPAVTDRQSGLWALKVLGSGNHMLMGIATKEPQMRQLLQEKADVCLEIINGRMSPDDFDRTNNTINKRIMDSTDHIQRPQIDRVRAAYRSRIAETETALIAYSVFNRR